MKRRTIGHPGWRGPCGLLFALSLMSLAPSGVAPEAKEPVRSPTSTVFPADRIGHPPAERPQVVDLIVGEGDTLYGLLGRAGVGVPGRTAVMDAIGNLFDPRALQPGDRIRLVLRTESRYVTVRSLHLELSTRKDLTVDLAAPDKSGKSPTPARGARIDTISFAPPVPGAEPTSLFGWRIHPVFGDYRFHKGVDFRAPRGTPVSASADGVVVEVGWRGNYGKYIRVRHSATVETTYSHLSGYASGLRAGKRVRQGQVIGYVGRTGVATGNHLYYEMLINGEHVDPLDPPPLIPDPLDGKNLTALKSSIRVDGLN